MHDEMLTAFQSVKIITSTQINKVNYVLENENNIIKINKNQNKFTKFKHSAQIPELKIPFKSWNNF